MNETLKLGIAGAAGIYIARKIPQVRTGLDQAAPYTKGDLPIIPAGFMNRNNWSAAFFILPAIGAWYLTK